MGLPQDDPKRRKPDITQARTLLHWEPLVDRRRAWRSLSSTSGRWFDRGGSMQCEGTVARDAGTEHGVAVSASLASTVRVAIGTMQLKSILRGEKG